MKKTLFFILITSGISCFSVDHYVTLTSISGIKSATKQEHDPKSNKDFTVSFDEAVDPTTLPVDIIIRTSDNMGFVETKDGKRFGKDQNGNLIAPLKDIDFNLKNLQKYSIVIPWQGWDGKATVSVTAKKGNEVIWQLNFQDRDSKLLVFDGKTNQLRKQIDKKIHPHLTGAAATGNLYSNNLDLSKWIDCDLSAGIRVNPQTAEVISIDGNTVNCEY